MYSSISDWPKIDHIESIKISTAQGKKSKRKKRKRHKSILFTNQKYGDQNTCCTGNVVRIVAQTGTAAFALQGQNQLDWHFWQGRGWCQMKHEQTTRLISDGFFLSQHTHKIHIRFTRREYTVAAGRIIYIYVL